MLNKIINILLSIIFATSLLLLYKYCNYKDMNHQQELKQLKDKCEKEKFERSWYEMSKKYYEPPKIDSNDSYIEFKF